jgi:tRNA(Ile)-lysidine synthase TilS/MesJ
LHVHHGLHPQADAWLRHCETTCQTWARDNGDLRFVATRLRDRPAPGESVEAWARQQRYCALRSMALAEGASLVLLAHHGRDQAETFVLQALRGAGMAGQAPSPRPANRPGRNGGRQGTNRRALRSTPMSSCTALRTSKTTATMTCASRATACAGRCGQR